MRGGIVTAGMFVKFELLSWGKTQAIAFRIRQLQHHAQKKDHDITWCWFFVSSPLPTHPTFMLLDEQL